MGYLFLLLLAVVIKYSWFLFFILGTYMNHTQASSCDDCPPRYYCVNKDVPDPCPKGRYCPSNTGFNQSLCPSGTYNPVEMLMSESECVPCDGGFYCDRTGQVNTTGVCAAGYFCQGGVNTAAPSNNNTGYGGKYVLNLLLYLGTIFGLVPFLI